MTIKILSGDTLYAIAKKFNTTIDAIMTLNNLSNSKIYVGQKLQIPQYAENNYIQYIVQKGDSLYAIAKKYNTTVNAIKEANNLTSDLLSIGQVLQIPTNSNNSENYLTYTVKNGDTLYAIARKYNTTVNKIMALNNLTTTNLSIGQKLIIPI